ncbi:Plasma protease C1 inhibitor [Sciurus carolinensis]|uniref:Plasma protease C1 inhibitor n=1 Tax=Sciurus carolinensis TaxID=30640 RepID=A0AA41SVZ2_SCICA|nr:Plasma protease C1 inhibitor [Sciurus carolinensis]
MIKAETNTAFFPFNIISLLTQVLPGAGDSIKRSLESILSYSKDVACVQQALKAFMSKGITSVSPLFYSPDQAIKDTSVNTSQGLYGSRWRLIPQQGKRCQLGAVHTWVVENTNHKIS